MVEHQASEPTRLCEKWLSIGCTYGFETNDAVRQSDNKMLKFNRRYDVLIRGWNLEMSLSSLRRMTQETT